jgi:hypothetical protein
MAGVRHAFRNRGGQFVERCELFGVEWFGVGQASQEEKSVQEK